MIVLKFYDRVKLSLASRQCELVDNGKQLDGTANPLAQESDEL